MYSSLMFPHLGMNEEVVYVTDETFLLEVQKASPQEPEFASQLTVCEFWKHRNTLIDLDKVPVKFVLRPPKTQVSSDFMFFVQHVLVTHHYLTASLPSGCRFKVCMTHLLDLHVSFSFLRDCLLCYCVLYIQCTRSIFTLFRFCTCLVLFSCPWLRAHLFVCVNQTDGAEKNSLQFHF